MSFRVVGNGEPVVLVHGLAGSSRWWARNVARLGESFALHLVDLPRGRDFALARAHAWLADAMAAAGLERAHVIGHSMGSAIALRLAAEQQQRVDRLVLVAPAGLATGRSFVGHAVPLAHAARRLSPAFLPLLVADAVRAGPVSLLRAARELLAGDVRELLGAVTAPTLLVFGGRDTLVPPSLGEIFRAEMRAARLLVIDDAGHVPMYDRPETFDAAVLEFLAQPSSATS
jgi:pimeloyl-ACP methyl ester carboxylesterase